MDFDDFDWEDAATFGGIAGFVEESLREENRRDPSEIPDDDDFERMEAGEMVPSLKRQLQMLAAGNPERARYVIRRAREDSEQWALQAQARRLVSAADRAYKRQDEEAKKGTLNEERTSDALTQWVAYKWASLGEEEHEKYPELYWLEEVIGEGWKVVLDYRKLDGTWEEGLMIQPKRFAKNKGKIYIHAFCEQWNKEYYFRLDRARNMKPAPETEEKGAGGP